MRIRWLALLVLVLPSTARADLSGCLLTGSNSEDGASMGCEGLELCGTEGLCRDGLACNAAGLCLPECSTLVGCDRDEECGTLRAGGTCQRFATGVDLGAAGVCTAPDLPIQYCNGTGPISVNRFLACHALPFSDTLAPSWFDGDCDRDGCPNGSDPFPCVSGSTCGRPDAEAAVCPHRLVGVGPERCVFLPSSEIASCATAHPCSARSDCPEGFACPAGTCEPTACTALYSCRHLADCPEGTELGEPILCLPTTRLDPGLGHGDGFCLFASFGVTAACTALGDARSCFVRDGRFSNDFFQGDCDLDGCPNGLDPSPCSADVSEPCRPDGVSPACGTSIPPARDAGVPFDDAALPDGGAIPFDAAPFDAAPFDGGVDERVTFGGGSGCVCTAHSPKGPRAPMALLAVLLLLPPLRRALGPRPRARTRV